MADESENVHPALNPINWAASVICAVFTAFTGWAIGLSPRTIVFFAVATFVVTFAGAIIHDRDQAAAVSRMEDDDSSKALADVHAVKLKQEGLCAASLGFFAVWMIHYVIGGSWLLAAACGVGVAAMATLFLLEWTTNEELTDSFLRPAWLRHMIVLSVLGAIIGFGGLYIGKFVSMLGASLPKTLAFGITPNNILGGCAAIFLCCLVWLVNRSLAWRAAKGVGEEESRARDLVRVLRVAQQAAAAKGGYDQARVSVAIRAAIQKSGRDVRDFKM